jgi:glycosyltransferase involved in cell wall biosynthesis
VKICYIANIRLPTEKAHGIQIMKMCEAFALLGHDINLLVPKRHNPITEDPFNFYEIKTEARGHIHIKYIPTINLIRFGRVGFWLQTWFFAELASIEMRRDYPDVVYSRDPIILFNMFFIHKNLVWEAHRGEMGFMIRKLLRKAKLISISWGLAHVYEKFTNKILISPDGVDLEQFSIANTKEESRKMVGFSPEKKIALYCGHLYDWKGAQYLADAALKFSNYEQAVFVGGTDKDVELFKIKNKDNPHILILGHKPHKDIPLYLKAADVLILPNSAKEAISREYTSPLKLFEYLASETPIVYADLFSLDEIMRKILGYAFEPDNSDHLYIMIKHVFEHPDEAKIMAKFARTKVGEYTWNARAQKIIDFIQP